MSIYDLEQQRLPKIQPATTYNAAGNDPERGGILGASPGPGWQPTQQFQTDAAASGVAGADAEQAAALAFNEKNMFGALDWLNNAGNQIQGLGNLDILNPKGRFAGQFRGALDSRMGINQDQMNANISRAAGRRGISGSAQAGLQNQAQQGLQRQHAQDLFQLTDLQGRLGAGIAQTQMGLEGMLGATGAGIQAGRQFPMQDRFGMAMADQDLAAFDQFYQDYITQQDQAARPFGDAETLNELFGPQSFINNIPPALLQLFGFPNTIGLN